MKCNIDRIMGDIETMASYSKDTGCGCTRPSFSEEDLAARAYIKKELEAFGIESHEDGAGNIRARLGTNGNSEGPAVLVGSHIDTVNRGGRYDGVLGVVAAMEVLRTFKENNLETRYPVELIIFSEEEGSNFGIPLIGSKSIAGKIDLDYLKNLKNDTGENCYAIMKSRGYDIDRMPEYTLKKDEVRAMLELHIEQGDILDREGCPVGIVDAISGINNYKVTLDGVANHAGATPMDSRKDPMVGASEIIKYLYEAAHADEESSRVVTVGKIQCYPNSTNVIAERVELFVDMRDTVEAGLDRTVEDLKHITKVVAEKYGLNISTELVGSSDIVHLSDWLISEIDSVANHLDIPHKKMRSGAVHDSAMLNDVTDVGMIFVPSINGRSHCAEEFTKREDIETGCNLLLHSVAHIAEVLN